MSNYYLIIKGKQKGPYTAERMQGMWANKNIAPGTLCQKEGETGSRPIEQFSEITSPKPKAAPQMAAATTPTTSAAQKTTSTTGAWPLPLKYIIPALAVLLLVAVIAVVAIIGNDPPVITRQPAGVTGSAGATVSFDINATDASSYQWQKDDVNIAGATAATLKLTNVQHKDNGTYSVVVSNDAGSVTSSGAALAVTRPPDVTIANLTDEKKIAKAVGRVVVGWNTEDSSGAQEEYLTMRLRYTLDEAKKLPRETQEKLREIKPDKPDEGKKSFFIEYVLGGTGTCFMITPDGYAITNAHVVESYDRIQRADKKREKIKNQWNKEKITPIILVYFGGLETKAKLVYISSEYDLAILKIEGAGKAPYFALSSTDEIKRGNSVTALGFPGAADEEVSGAGAAVRRSLRENYKMIHELFPEEKCRYNQNSGKISAPSDKAAGRLIQHDAIINPGNSGGPLVDSSCTVLGINTFRVTRNAAQGVFLSLQMHQLRGEIDKNLPTKAVWK